MTLISTIPVDMQVGFFLSDIFLLSLLTSLSYLLPNQKINFLPFCARVTDENIQ